MQNYTSRNVVKNGTQTMFSFPYWNWTTKHDIPGCTRRKDWRLAKFLILGARCLQIIDGQDQLLFEAQEDSKWMPNNFKLFSHCGGGQKQSSWNSDREIRETWFNQQMQRVRIIPIIGIIVIYNMSITTILLIGQILGFYILTRGTILEFYFS